jgi:hypothetical protein
MVIKSKIYEFLKENLGEYLYGFEKNQLDVGLLSGRIELVNVNFRPDKVNELLGSQGLPIHIKAGLIGKLKLKCNYISFLTSPVEVELDELLLVFGPISLIYKEQKMNVETDPEVILWQLNKEDEILNYSKRKARSQALFDAFSASEAEKSRENQEVSRKSRSKNRESQEKGRRKSKRKQNHSDVPHGGDEEVLDPSHLQNNGFNFEQKLKSAKSSYTEESYSERPKKKTFVEKYFTKVLRNLTLTVKTVHISYEDESYSFENPFSIGFSVEKIEIKNVSQEWTVSQGKAVKVVSKNKTNIKEILISNAAVYIYGMASVVIPTSLWEGTINSEIGIFEAFPAYEVREFIIHQSKLLSKDHASTFLQPTSAKACITFSEEFPELKAVGLVESISFKFTPVMAECLRNFYDYCTNVQIWPLVLRYRPVDRIPGRKVKREHRKERKFRKEVISKWFFYAFQFAKLKNAALRYVRERRKEREFIQKMENNEKIRAKANASRKVEKKVEEKKNEGTLASIFNIGKNITVPSGIGNFIGNNAKKPPIVQKQLKRPYDGEKYFSKVLTNSEIEIHVNLCKVSLSDDSNSFEIEVIVHEFSKCMTTLMDEMNSIILVQDFCLNVKAKKTCQEFFRCSGKKFSKSSSSDYAFKAKVVYRPAEVLNPNDLFTTLNMYESSIDIGTFNINYNHFTISRILEIIQCLKFDKAFRANQNEDFLKKALETLTRKKNNKFFNKTLKKKISSQKLASQIGDIQKWVEEKIVEINSTFSFIMFRFELNSFGGIAGLCGKDEVVLKAEFPSCSFSVVKGKELTCLNGFGFSLKTASTPAGLYDFLNIIAGILNDKLKRLKRVSC